jgi:hypothetical protein
MLSAPSTISNWKGCEQLRWNIIRLAGEKLCEYVKERPAKVEYFYKYFLPEFAEAVYGFFRQYIEQTAARANSRKDYQRVCVIIGNLKKADGKELALEIKQKLICQYANRPAFRDELSRV